MFMVLVSSDQVKEKVNIPFIFLYQTYFFPKEGVQVYWSIACVHSLFFWIQKYAWDFLEGLTNGNIAAFSAWHLRKQDSDSLPELYQYLVAGSCAFI